MKIMKLYPILMMVFVLGFSNIIKAQRPMPIKQLQPIIDSVSLEVNRMYALSEAKTKGLVLLSKKEEQNFICYPSNDTLLFVQLSDSNTALKTMHFNLEDQKLLLIDSNVRALTKDEASLFIAKQAAIKEAQKKKYLIETTDKSEIDYVFYTNANGFSLYAMAIPTMDSILTFGNDHLFLFDEQMKLKSYKQLAKPRKPISIRKIDNPRGSKLLGVSAPVGIKKNQFYMLIPYYYKFRRFHMNLRISELASSINKRFLRYDASKNEISIELFPIEKR